MNQQALERLREGRQDCPSGLDLDHLESGELPPAAAAQLASHIGSCARCQAAMEARKAGLGAFPRVNPDSLLAAIQSRVELEAVDRKRRGLRRRLVTFGMPLLAVAAALLIVQFWRGDSGDVSLPGDGTRAKGGLVLRVYRFSENRAQRVASGDRFVPGDRLRFVIDVPRSGHVSVLGVEASGRMYVSWPLMEGGPTLRSAGSAQELPGTVALDRSQGRETLYLAHCPPTVGPPSVACKSGGATAPPLCPASCALTSFVLDKQPSK